MKIIEKKISELKPYKANPRNNDASVDAVAESIKAFGFQVPMVIDKNGEIITGHTRLKAAKKLKMKTVPCVIAEELNEQQIKAFRLADNKVGETSEWNEDLLRFELDNITDFDMSDFGFEDLEDIERSFEEPEIEDDRDPSCQHNVFENQEMMQFPSDSFYGMPKIEPTETVGDKMLRFMDWKEVDDPENYIAHFYYDDYKFINAWREPDKYLERLKRFKAVVSPDFSLYTDFPRALQILSCYRRQWCGAYWNFQGIDVIPDVVWGDEESYEYCFDGIPKHSTVAVSSLGVRNDPEWNSIDGDMFRNGYEEMMKRLEPTTILFYGSMIEGCEGNIIRIPSYYEVKFKNGEGE